MNIIFCVNIYSFTKCSNWFPLLQDTFAWCKAYTFQIQFYIKKIFNVFIDNVYKYITFNIWKHWQVYEYNDDLHVSQYLVILVTLNTYRKIKIILKLI